MQTALPIRRVCRKSAAGSALGAFFITLLTLCQTSFADPANTRCQPFAQTEPVTIAKVIDGDTVRLTDGRKIRLIGINTPELVHSDNLTKHLADKAKRALTNFLNENALLLSDQGTQDPHGRTLAHLYNQQGDSAEAFLLGRGLGWHVAIPPNLTLATCLNNAERYARKHQLGIWSATGIAATAAAEVKSGGFQRVIGTVTDINFTDRAWWLNLGPQLAAVIYPEDQQRFSREQLTNLIGQSVELRGWVYPSRSKRYQPWRIKLQTPFAIEWATQSSDSSQSTD